jgi:hypothetical protein
MALENANLTAYPPASDVESFAETCSSFFPLVLKLLDISNVADHVDRSVHQLLSQEAIHGRLTPEQLDDYGPHLVNAILHAAGIVDYRSNVDLTETPLAHLRLGEKLNGIAINAQREFFGSSLPSRMVRGTAAPLSHLAEVGKLFARPEELARQYAGQEANDRAHGMSDEKEEVSGGAEQNPAVGASPPKKHPGGFSAEPGKVTLGALRDWNKVATTFKDFWTSTFQPELFSDRALEADPLVARYKSRQAQEKDAVIKTSEEEWTYQTDQYDYRNH